MRPLSHGRSHVGFVNALGLESCIFMGNQCSTRLRAAKDYVRMQWMMLQQNEPTIMIATGKQYSVREFVLGVQVI